MKVLPKNASQFSDLYGLSFNKRVGYSIWHSSTQEGFYHQQFLTDKNKKVLSIILQKKIKDYSTIFKLFPCDYKSFLPWCLSF